MTPRAARPPSVEELFDSLVSELRDDRRLGGSLEDEPDVEREVWRVVWKVCGCWFSDEKLPGIVLSSHESLQLPGRSAAKRQEFLSEKLADLEVLGAKKRLDLVVRHPGGATIGIEVECLSGASPADQLIVGLGQVLLARAHRDPVLLVAHCGRASAHAPQVREIAGRVAARIPRFAIVIRP